LLAYGNANEITMQMAREILPVIRHTPILAGVNGTDPFMLTEMFLSELKTMGIAGIQNFPTVGLIDGVFRQNLEETGMSYAMEVEMIRIAHNLDLLTTPYVFCEGDAEAMAKAGADIIIAHMGLTTGGTIGAETALKLQDCPRLIDTWAAAAKRHRPDIIVLCHGGPIATPADAQFILDTCVHCDGFYGASSMERLPVETALTDRTREFRALTRSIPAAKEIRV
jgi:predicted TIM-barrel enzyme